MVVDAGAAEQPPGTARERRQDVMKEFLNAKSMATPGIAGAVAMLITNTLVERFELPGEGGQAGGMKWSARR
jgi:hypothetical protein